MANTFTLSGTLLDAQNNPAYVGRYMVLRVTSVGTDTEDAASYPRDSVSFLIDENGDWTSGATLWVNGDSGILSYYEILEPSGQRVELVFPSAVEGTTVRYEYALENYLAAGAAEQQSPALGAHIADLDNPHQVTAAQAGAYTEAEADAEFVNKTSEQTISGAKHFSYIDISTDLGIGSGGTGASTAADARTNLGVAIGTDVQAYDATILVDADIGSTVQAYDAVLDATTASFLVADETKLDGIEALADVTDAANVIAAGAYTVGGTDVAVTDGGTGASTASDARSNLGFPDNAVSGTTTVSATSYTVLSTDRIILVDDDTAGSDVTLTLPSAATLGDGWTCTIKKLGSTADVILDPDGTETIDEESSRTMRQKKEATSLSSDGTNWRALYPSVYTGWAQYVDGEYTSGSPLAVNNAKVQLTIDTTVGTGSKEETYLPSGVDEFWDETSNTIQAQKAGDAYTVRVNFTGDPGGVDDFGEIIFDIGDGSPDIPIATRTIVFAKATATSVSTTTSLFSLATFIANGCKIYFDTTGSGDSIDVYDISVVITRTHSPL
mgnify:CR=1 FL=1